MTIDKKAVSVFSCEIVILSLLLFLSLQPCTERLGKTENSKIITNGNIFFYKSINDKQYLLRFIQETHMVQT